MTLDGKDYQGHNLVFLLGSSRSGKSYLKNLLSNHQTIRVSSHESDLIKGYVGGILRKWNRNLDNGRNKKIYTGLPWYMEEETFLPLVRKFTTSLLQNMVPSLPDNEIFIEESPGNLFYLDEIQRLFPESRFIHILRDGRDVVASILAASRSWGRNWASSNPRRAARGWCQDVEELLRARGKMKTSQFHEVAFEDLAANPVDTLLRLTDFLGISWGRDDMQIAIENTRRNRNAPAQALRGEFANLPGQSTKDDFSRKEREPVSWKDYLSMREKFWVWYSARKTMAKVGYDWKFFLS